MNQPTIPTDSDTVAAWAFYELRNAAANAEYRRRHGAVDDKKQRLQVVTA